MGNYITKVELVNHSPHTIDKLEVLFLHIIFYMMGVVDFKALMKELKLPGRTKIIDGYRTMRRGYSHNAKHFFKDIKNPNNSWSWPYGFEKYALDWKIIQYTLKAEVGYKNVTFEEFIQEILKTHSLTDLCQKMANVTMQGNGSLVNLFTVLNTVMDNSPNEPRQFTIKVQF